MSDFKKIREYKKKRQPKPEMSKAEFLFHCERAADKIMEVFDRLPENAPPVNQSFAELLDEMNDLTRRRETIIQSGGRRIRVDESGKISVIQNPANDGKKATDIKSGSAELSASDTGNFTPEQLKILEEFKNG